MNNILKRLFYLIMVLTMVVTLVACGEEDEEPTSRRRGKNTETTSDTTGASSNDMAYLYEGSTPEEETTEEEPVKEFTELSKDARKLVGTWTAELDGTTAINMILSDELGVDVEIEDYVLVVTMTFNDDGTVEAEGDASRVAQAMLSVADKFWEGILKSAADQTGMSTDEVEKMMEQQGMTKEVFLEDMEQEAMFAVSGDMHLTGRWMLDGDELYVDEKKPENTDPVVIEFKGDNEFHIVEVPEDPDDMGQYLLPLVFKRVG